MFKKVYVIIYFYKLLNELKKNIYLFIYLKLKLYLKRKEKHVIQVKWEIDKIHFKNKPIEK